MKKNIFEKLRSDKGARAIAVTIVLMLLVLTTIIVATVVANRTKDDYSEPAGVTDPDTDNPQGSKPEDPNPENPTPDAPSDGGEDKETNTMPEHFLLPVDGVLQKHHSTEVQVFSDTMGDYRMHAGIDIGTVAGAAVSVMADGVISRVWDDVYMGKCVAVAHGGDAYTIYKNLAAELPESVVEGTAVKAGDIIGTVGESAMIEVKDEPHLHLEMTVGGLAVDPTDYLDADAMASLGEDTNYEDES